MFSWKMAAAWGAALVVTTFLTWQIVSAADSQVGESPAAIAPTVTSTSMPPTTTTTQGGPSSSTGTSSPTTPTTSSSTSSTSTTSPSSQAAWSLRTVSTSGGTVVVRYRTGAVELQAATPALGYDVEVDDAGPPSVRVEFESDDSDVRVDVEWKDGGLDVEVSD